MSHAHIHTTRIYTHIHIIKYVRTHTQIRAYHRSVPFSLTLILIITLSLPLHTQGSWCERAGIRSLVDDLLRRAHCCRHPREADPSQGQRPNHGQPDLLLGCTRRQRVRLPPHYVFVRPYVLLTMLILLLPFKALYFKVNISKKILTPSHPNLI